MTLKFVVMSDLHLMPEGEVSMTLDTAARLEAAVNAVNARYGDADFCVLAGDLADLGQAAAYERLKTIFGRLEIPVHVTLGNHDDRPTFLDVMGAEYAAETGNVDKVIEWAREQTRERFGDAGWELHYSVFGRNGVMGDMEPLKDKPGHELCILVQGVAATREQAEEVAITGTRQLFYARLPDVKGTAGGVAFPLDEVMAASPAYHWTMNHTMAVGHPLELFPTHFAMVG